MSQVGSMMKRSLVVFMILVSTNTSQAGLVGWLTSETRDWAFVLRTGGMRIGAPVEKAGKRWLPVEYDVSGLTAIAQKPTLMNSGLVVRRITATRADKQIVLRVITQAIEKGSASGSTHYADISGFPPGVYDVFYERAGDAEKHLGRIELK